MNQKIKSVSWRKVEKKSKTEQQNKIKDSKSELQDNMKHNNIHIIGIPEGEEEEQGIENLFEKVKLF